MRSFFDLTAEQRSTLLRQFKFNQELNLDSNVATLRAKGAGSKSQELRAYLQKLKALGGTKELLIHLLEVTSELSDELAQSSSKELPQALANSTSDLKFQFAVSPPQYAESSSKVISYQEALKEVIEEAEQELLISTYSFHNPSLTRAHPESASEYELQQALSVLLQYKATLASKKLKIKLIINLKPYDRDDHRSHEERLQDLNLALQRAWPPELDLPSLWYEVPASTTSHYAKVHQSRSQHSKLVIADARVALLGSANLSEAAYERNLELGCLIRSSEYVTELLKLFKAFKSTGLLSTLPLELSEKKSPNWISQLSQEELEYLKLMSIDAFHVLHQLNIHFAHKKISLPTLNQREIEGYETYIPIFWADKKIAIFDPVDLDGPLDSSVLITERESIIKQLTNTGWCIVTLREVPQQKLIEKIISALTGV